jgi:hypothetical protein
MLRLNLAMLSIAIGNLQSMAETMMQARLKGGSFAFHGSFHSLQSITVIELIAGAAGMPVTAAAATRLKNSLDAVDRSQPLNGTSYEARSIEDAVSDLVKAFHSDCEKHTSLIVHPDRVKFFEQVEPLFGNAVSLKFGKIATDIAEAGKCYALERPTACVFHLMRVAEFAVKRLGKKLRVEIEVEKETWYQITVHINKKVDALPNGTASQQRRKQALAAAAAHLNSVRIATRNDVMHPKATYTDEEALTVLEATKALMQQMVKLA